MHQLSFHAVIKIFPGIKLPKAAPLN